VAGAVVAQDTLVAADELGFQFGEAGSDGPQGTADRRERTGHPGVAANARTYVPSAHGSYGETLSERPATTTGGFHAP